MIYLDYAATTPVHPRVLDAMLPYFRESYGNPSSVHRYGQKAESALDAAREKVAAVLHCRPDEIIFTSCGSESDNLALRGAAFAKRKTSGKKWILTARNEHHAVSRTAEQLQKEFGFLLEWLDLGEHGAVIPDSLNKAICNDTALVSLMYANNEIGTITVRRSPLEVIKMTFQYFLTPSSIQVHVQGHACFVKQVQQLRERLVIPPAPKRLGEMVMCVNFGKGGLSTRVVLVTSFD